MVPVRSLQTAGELFDSDGSCHATGGTIIPMEGHFYEMLHAHQHRRLLQSVPQEQQQRTPVRSLQQVSPEFASEYDRQLFNRAASIKQLQQARLRQTGWLGNFEPMFMSCPLTARKVSPEAVSEFAALAWRCDGLGFAWDCLAGPGRAASAV